MKVCIATLCLGLLVTAAAQQTRSDQSRDALLQGTFELRPEWQGVHPRLFTDAHELDQAIQAWKSDPKAFESVFPNDKTLSLAPEDLSKAENAIGDSILLARMAVALRITGDSKYAAALKRWIPKLQEMEPIRITRMFDANKDLSAGHFLLGIAIVYDVLRGAIKPADEAVIRNALIAQARQTYNDLMALPTYPYEQNHFSIPLAGLAIASMNLVDELPEAKTWCVFSRNTLSRCLAAVAHDGWFFEGISYWSFTMQFPVAYASALKRLTDENLFTQPPFRDAPAYLNHMFLPGGNFAFDFADWGPRRRADDTFQKGYDYPWHTFPTRINLFILHLLQRETKDPALADLANLLGGYHDLKPIDQVLLPLWQVKLPDAPVPLKDRPGHPPYRYFDDMEVVHWRENWNDTNATALAFKSGPPAGHQIATLYPLYPEWKPALGHAHPDAGSFLLFSHGVFLANDTGYVGKKESADHNCILVDGVGQFKGGKWNAFDAAPYEKYNKIRMTNVWLTPHVAAGTALYRDAYDDALELKECRRDLIMVDGKWLLIRDRLESAVPHVYEWRLHTDREARLDGDRRWIMDNGPARLVIRSLSPIANATIAPTVVETDWFVPGRKRPQQRGFHLALSSPKQKNFEFLTALFIQSSTSTVECTTSTGTDGRVVLAAGKERCEFWLGESDWTFASYDADGRATTGRWSEQPPATVLTNFVTAKNGRLYDGERELRYISVNMPDALQLITHYDFDGDYSATRFRLPDEGETRDCIRTVRQLGGQVLRVFVITCRPYNDTNFMFNVASNPVIPNEAALRVIDRVLQVCHEEGVRVIIPLVAHNSPKIRGDWTTYGQDFWKVGSEANLKFKNMVTQLLGRTNHYTGVVYRDDPAILGWQTGNELVISNNLDRVKWLHDIAALLKRLDPNHLVIDGRNRPWDVYENYEEFAADPNIDVVSYHTYADLPGTKSPTETLRLMNKYIRGRKVLLVTEISKNTPLPVLRELLDEVLAGSASGCNFWALRYHNRDGGFYKHSDKNSQFEDLNWPGFPGGASYLPEIGHESALLNTFAEYGWRIRGLARPPLPIPSPPELLPVRDPGHITWRGATAARSYSIERATSPNGPWTKLATNVPDNLTVYATQFCDRTAEPGRSYYYRGIAHNECGDSSPSTVVGPVPSTESWLVDELFDLSQADPASHNLRLDKSYGHTDYLEDLSVATRQDTNQSASLIYRLPGPVRSVSASAHYAAKTPRLVLVASDGSKRELEPELGVYDGGKRKRLRARVTAGEATTLEIILPADSTTNAAIGRVEISFELPADSQSYRESPGLRQADGSPHEIVLPAGRTGRSLNVTPYLQATRGSLADDPTRDDRPAIEATLQDARPGDEIYLPDGVYNLNSAWSKSPRANLVLPAGVSIRGQSRAGTILKSTLDDRGEDFHSVLLIEGVSNLAVSNLTITSSWNRKYSAASERNNPEAGGPGYAVTVGGDRANGKAASNIIIENVVVEKYRRMGVRLGAGTHDVIVRNCQAQNATDLGGGGSGYGFVISGPGHTNATINPWLGSFRDTYWNTIDSCTTGPLIRHAVVIQFWAHNNLVTHNRFTSALDAIDLHGEDEYRNEVASNEVFDVAWQSAVGIGNNGATHDKSGPWNWIHDNKFTGCKSGVTVEFGSEFQRIENNLIHGNTKYPGGHGIGLGNTKHTVVRNNIISSNTAPAYAAILIFFNKATGAEPSGSPVDCTVTNNVLTGNTRGVVWEPSLPETARLVNTIQENSSAATIDRRP